nr:hypothetical protein [Pirellula staleyi]
MSTELHQWCRHYDTLHWATIAFLGAGITALLVRQAESEVESHAIAVTTLILTMASLYLMYSFRTFDRYCHEGLRWLDDQIVYFTECKYWWYKQSWVIALVHFLFGATTLWIFISKCHQHIEAKLPKTTKAHYAHHTQSDDVIFLVILFFASFFLISSLLFEIGMTLGLLNHKHPMKAYARKSDTSEAKLDRKLSIVFNTQQHHICCIHLVALALASWLVYQTYQITVLDTIRK